VGLRGRGVCRSRTSTIRVDGADTTLDVDTGFIVDDNRNHPNFERLLRRLRVASQRSEWRTVRGGAWAGWNHPRPALPEAP
jgi:predicted NAD/FAD-binding protein